MLAEALVIFACVNSSGCTETSTQYFNTHPEIKEVIMHHEKKVEKILGPTFIQAFGPMIFAAAGGTGAIRLSKHFNLQISPKQSTLVFGKEL